MPSNAFSRFAQKVKEHNDSVNAAYTAFYGIGSPSSSSAAPSARPSMDSQRSTSSNPAPERRSSKTWQKVKKAAKDHHEAVNQAYTSLYAPGTSSAPSSRRESTRSSGEWRRW